ncbi:MAG: SapC family protein [Pseudomonadota bacterium]
MTTQLLIYESAVAVSAERHRNWSIKAGHSFRFAERINSAPLTAVEFAPAASEHVIVFSGKEDAVVPGVILGIQEGRNTYVNEGGKWRARYVPAFFRRYPFVFATHEDKAQFTLCVDENFEGWNQEGRGEHLFDSDGEQTTYLQRVLTFLSEYQAHFQRTRGFCDRLRALDLLEPMQAQFTLPSGERGAMQGFMTVNRDRLKALPGDALAELVASDALKLIYLHLHSLRNFQWMVQTANESRPKSALN